MFSQPKLRINTWTMPEGGSKYQFKQYINKEGYRNAVEQKKNYPDADIGFNQNIDRYYSINQGY